MYFLQPLIENEDKNAGPKPELSGNLKKRILSAFSYINRIIEKEAGGGFSTNAPVTIEPEVEGLMFSQSVLNLHIGEEKQLRLYYNKKNIPTGSRITLTSSNDGIDFYPNELINESDRDETYFVVTIIGKNVNSQSILRAYSDSFEAKLIINVLPLENLVLDNGFAFLPNEITLYTGKTRKLRLLYDSRLIKKGSIIRVTTGDNRIKLIKNRFEVERPNINKFLVQTLIEVKSNTPNIKSEILAKVKSTGDELKAICTVRTTEKDAPKKFFKDFRLDDKKDGRQRSSFENGIVYVHVNSPILKNYFGNKQERLNEKKEKDAIAILADTVLQCLSRAMATYYVESGTVDSLSTKEVEIEYQRQNIEYEHGEVIHQMITKIHLNGKDKLN
jgi:hypothetical protein